MTTLTRPTWLRPRDCTLALRKSGLQFVSPFNGTLQAIENLAERWALQMTIPGASDGGARSAFFNQWAGGVNHVPLYHFGRPQPLGTLRGAPTLASATARGDTSLALAGARGANHLLNGSFEADSNADGLADGWTRYSSGSSGPLLQSRDTSTFVILGTYSQWLRADSLGATSADQHGIYAEIVDATALRGSSVTISARVLGTPGASCSLQLAWADGASGSLGAINSTPLVLTGGSQSVQATGVCPSATARGVLYVYQHSGPGGAVGLYVDQVRVEAGTTIGTPGAYATLLAGDMLGASGQLFMVAADCTGTDAGAMTVPVVNRCRSVVAGGTVLQWDRPTALFALPAMEQSTTWLRGGVVDSIALDAVEVY